MKRRFKEKLTVVLFCLMIGSAYLIWPVARHFFEGENTENRNLEEAPVFSLKTIRDYPQKIETYLNDHLPFRNVMIELNSMIDYYLKLPTPKRCV